MVLPPPTAAPGWVEAAVSGAAVVAARSAGIATRRARLEALSPHRTLERGYSITLTASGSAVTDATSVSPGQRLRTLVRSGELESDVVSVSPAGDRSA